MSVPSAQSEITAEQNYVDTIYARLDHLRAEAERQLTSTIRDSTTETDQGVRERQHLAERLAQRAAGLTAAERGLVIGRLDTDDGDRLYLGRTGIADDNRDPMLIDWRAPVAAAFYRATPAERLGIRLRRHIHLRNRQVVGVDDDVLDFTGVDGDDQLTGEAALLNALRQARTGRMADIVATIQGEQDTIIRSGLSGILVVEGGPGTGKTVVALHRAAYLLYTHRDRLQDKGILVIGPNRTFLRYVEQVLPGLGETDVVLSSVGDLYPPLRTTTIDPPETAMIKGDPRMAGLLSAAVADYQRAPEGGLHVVVGEDEHELDADFCRGVRDRARERAGHLQLTHNRVRPYVVGLLLDELVGREMDRLERMIDEVEVPDLIEGEEDKSLKDMLDPVGTRALLAASDGFARAADQVWPELTPERVLTDLFSDAELRRRVGADLTEAERAALADDPTAPSRFEGQAGSASGPFPEPVEGQARSTSSPEPVEGQARFTSEPSPDHRAWTVSDVPLLDELAELLGPAQELLDAEAAHRRRTESIRETEGHELDLAAEEAAELALEYADEDYGEIRIEGSEVLARYYDAGVIEPLADRARRDREWAYGHVIIDEAQELSPMAWRVLARRCPTGSMTAVGDLAQASSPDSPHSWAGALDPVAAGRWRREALTVSYRSTGPILEFAGRILAASGSDGTVPRAARPDGDEPWTKPTTAEALARDLPELLTAERDLLGAGIVAVITTADRVEACRELVRTVCPEATTFAEKGFLDAPVAVLTPEESKGLEFDGVIIVAPEEILAAGRRGEHPPGPLRGHADLYVAATRPTRRLGLIPLSDFTL
ncbi:HelD family protein [Microlunatus speluncae]|uniref:HelD family protein n=1 Tax=Microlunatus speluncae TaxID=2594267 RepID=UPI001266833C|nr:DNA/RNA helicase domain-containing protein [Microlunatus speluncae]